MNWVENDELMSIFLAEVDARSATLLAGARDLARGPVPADTVTELIRDAHTLKGSAAMMQRHDLSDAAAKVEEAWRLLEKTETHAPVLGAALGAVVTHFPEAARAEGLPDGLVASLNRLDKLMATGRTDGRPPQQPKGPYGLAQAAPMPEEDEDRSDRRRTDAGGTLGGLLPTVGDHMDGSVIRVDSGNLYALINRIVELGIDIDTLEDLTHVDFGDDNSRLLAAWRAQIRRLAAETRAVQGEAVSLVNIPFGEALESFNQFVRFLGRRLQKTVRFEVSGAQLMIDRQIVDLLREPLRHVVVNAVDHGIEVPAERIRRGKPGSGTIRLDAALDDDLLVIAISDDGRGIDWESVRAEAERQGLPTNQSELASHLLRQGFSATDADTDFSGVGDGLSVLADAVDSVSGSITIQSVPGSGTTVRIDVPSSLLLQRVITVNAGGQVVGIVEAAVVDSVDVSSADEWIGYRDENIPIARLSKLVGGVSGSERIGLIVSTRSGLVGVAIDEILGERRLAVKNLGPILGTADHLAGAAFLGGGEVLVVVDHHYLGREARRVPVEKVKVTRVLVVDDSSGVRQLIAATLRGHGYEVEVASDAAAARRDLDREQFDALVVDYAMPGSNGTELVGELRKSGVVIPIIMVSGVASSEQKQAATDAGVDVYLDKYDFRQGALIDAIGALLTQRENGAADALE